MGAHDSLGFSSGTRCIDQDPGIFGRYLCFWLTLWGLPHECLVLFISFSLLAYDDVAIWPDILQTRSDSVHLWNKLVVHDERLGIRVVRYVLDLLADQAKVDGHDDESRFRCSQIDLDDLDAVFEQNGHLVSLVQSQRDEAVRQLVDPCV